MPNAKTYKAITWDWEELTAIDDTPKLRFLSDRDVVSLLVASSTFMTWKTRWWNKPPSFDVVDAYTAELSDRLMTEIDFCELMVDCIEGNLNVQTALTEIINQQITNNVGVGTNTGAGSTVLVDNCTNDERWGACVNAVDFLDQLTVDALEIVDTEADAWERASLFVRGFPGLGLLPIDEILEAVNVFSDGLLSQYQAAQTLALKDELACILFCGTQGCEITVKSAFDALSDDFAAPSFTTLLDVLDFIVVGGYTGSALVKAFYLAHLGFALFKNTLFGFTGSTNAFESAFSVGAQTRASGGWSSCPPCPTPTTSVTYNDVNFADWTVIRGNVPLFGAFGFSAGTSPFLLRVENFVLSGIMKQMDFVINFDANGNVRTLRVLLLDGVNVVFDQTQSFGVGNNQNFGWSVNLQFDQIIVIATAGTSGGAAAIIEMTYTYQ